MSLLGKLFGKKDDFDFDKDLDMPKDLSADMPSDMPKLDDLGLDDRSSGLNEKSLFTDDTDMSSSGDEFTQPSQLPQRASISQTSRMPAPRVPPPPGGNSMERDIELISSKLDTIKALLASLDQRIANIERANYGDNQQQQRLW